MGDLPPEIWRLILQYLPPAVLQDLSSVNSVFLDIAMDARYHDVVLLDRMGKKLLRNLLALQDPNVAHRVKSLRIVPQLFYSEAQKNSEQEGRTHSPATPSLLSRMIDRIQHGRQNRVDDEAADLFDASIYLSPGALTELLQRLKNIHTFYLDGSFFDEDNMIYLWPSIGQNLHDLTISVASIALETALSPPVVTFSHLQRLQIIIKTRPQEDEVQLSAFLSATASFVNLFQDTLRHLSIQHSRYGDISVLYERLGTFRRLCSADIDLSLPQGQVAGGDMPVHSVTFLQRHKHTIRDLSISDIGNQMSTFYFSLLGVGNNAQTFYYRHLRLPRLQRVSISANLMAGNLDDMQTFLRGHQDTLESLDITGPISSSEINILLLHIREFAGDKLTRLSISTYRLDLSLLLKLSEGLEQLKVLKLEIMKVAQANVFGFTPGQFFPKHLPPDEDVHEFVKEIVACHALKAWNLRDITIKRRSCCGDLVLWRLMQFLATCIPTITSFAENGDMFVPEPPNVRLKVVGAKCIGGGYECVYGRDGVDGILS